MNKLNVIILSNAANNDLFNKTVTTIESLCLNNLEVKFSIIVIEGNVDFLDKYSDYSNIYGNVDSFSAIGYSDSFGFNYNKSINLGLSFFNNDTEWYLICNNDLEFTEDSIENNFNLIEHWLELKSISSVNPNWHLHQHFNQGSNTVFGYEVPVTFVGWVHMFHKDLLKLPQPLFNEQIKFWYSDNWTAEVIKRNEVQHCLNLNSVVYHEAGSSHKLVGQDKYEEYTSGQAQVFNNEIGKWFS